MATILEIITRSAGAMGLVRSGQVPTGADAQDLLRKLQDVINALPLLRSGEWSDVILASSATYVASDGQRIQTNGYSATITLPTTYTDEDNATVPQKDLSRVQIIGGTQAGLWIYAASNGSWARCDALALTDTSPFGPEDDLGLAALVAVESADDYGAEVSAITVQRAADVLNSFRSRFYRDVTVKMDRAYWAFSDMGYRHIYDGLL
jgi:hypothetical protein